MVSLWILANIKYHSHKTGWWGKREKRRQQSWILATTQEGLSKIRGLGVGIIRAFFFCLLAFFGLSCFWFWTIPADFHRLFLDFPSLITTDSAQDTIKNDKTTDLRVKLCLHYIFITICLHCKSMPTMFYQFTVEKMTWEEIVKTS